MFFKKTSQPKRLPDVGRRSFVVGSIGAGLTAAAGAATAAAATATLPIENYGGGTGVADNWPAMQKAFAAANPGDTITFQAGKSYTFSSPVTWPGKFVNVKGDKTTWVVAGPHVAQSVNAADSMSMLSGIIAECGSATGVYVSGPQTFFVSSTTLYNPKTYGIQVMDANVHIDNVSIQGDGKNSSQNAAIYGGSGHKTTLTITNSTWTGCWRGLYSASCKSIQVSGCTANAFWWHLLPLTTSQQSTMASGSTATTGVTTSALSAPSNFTWAALIFTAYEKLGSGSITRTSGNWYSVSGLSSSAVQPRLVISNGSVFATVVDTNSSGQVRIDQFFDATTRHLVDSPASVSGVTFEKPYIGINRQPGSAINGTTFTVERWMDGPTDAATPPPAGARVIVSQACDYQMFSVKLDGDSTGTQDFNVSYSKVYNSFADSISSIGNVNTRVMHNEVWDGQDVGITLQWGTGITTATYNTTHRLGSAGIFVGSSGANVQYNTITGAQWIATSKAMYGAIQVEGADSPVVSNNTVTSTGGQWEVRGLLVEGRYGAYAALGDLEKGPFPMNGTYQGNKFAGYPDNDVTFQGTKSSTKTASWGNARIEYLEGATPAQAGK